MENYSILIVGQSWLLRQGVRPTLRKLQIPIIGEARDFIEAFTVSDKAAPPDAVLFLASGADEIKAGLAQLDLVRKRFAAAKLILLMEVFSASDVRMALEGGADGLLSCNVSNDLLISFLQLVMAGQKVFPDWSRNFLPVQEDNLGPVLNAAPEAELGPMREIDNAVLQQQNTASLLLGQPIPALSVESGTIAGLGSEATTPMLSGRERQTLGCLIHGKSNKVIARELGIAETTVKVHIKSLLRKLRATNRTQAAIWAISRGNDFTVGLAAEPLNVPVLHHATITSTSISLG